MTKLEKQAVKIAAEMLKNQYSINEVVVTPLKDIEVTEDNLNEMVAEIVAETLFQVNQIRWL